MSWSLLTSLAIFACILYFALAMYSTIKPNKMFDGRKKAFKNMLIAAFSIYVAILANKAGAPWAEHDSDASVAQTASDPEPKQQNESAMKVSTQNSQPPQTCGTEGIVFNDVVAVSGSNDIHEAPGKDAPRIVNEKATKALGKTFYQSVDSSTSVRRLCVQSDWTEIQIVSPDWLTHVHGWVPSKALRQIETDKSGKRQYVEDDIYWDKDTSKFKPQIVAAVNRISRENAQCVKPEPSLVAKSPARSKAGDPVFFLTCENAKGQMFNVWFRPDEVKDQSHSFAAIKPIDRTVAVNSCEAAAKNAATHPSTVDFSRIMDLGYAALPSGRSEVVSSFTAKNAFNLELKYQIRCLYDGNQMIETSIWEI